MPKQIITNTDLVCEYMDFGSPMNQIMLITAMDAYAKRITENEAEVREQFADSFIHPDSWIQSAHEWIKASEKQKQNNK